VIPWVSDLTGGWITPGEVARPSYWTTHLRQPVRFADALGTLLAAPHLALLEVGPGLTLATLARRHPRLGAGHTVVHSLPHPADPTPAVESMLAAAGRLWTAGADIDWLRLHEGDRPRRVPLPTYPFERQHYLVAPMDGPAAHAAEASATIVMTGAGDRNAGDAQEQPTGGDELSTSTERRLATVFGQILGLDHVGEHDNFFDLGGDSLIATQLIRWIHREFSVTLSIRQVFQAPTVAALNALISEQLATTQNAHEHLPQHAQEK
jgi:acyl transferase domain-containing protein